MSIDFEKELQKEVDRVKVENNIQALEYYIQTLEYCIGSMECAISKAKQRSAVENDYFLEKLSNMAHRLGYNLTKIE